MTRPRLKLCRCPCLVLDSIRGCVPMPPRSTTEHASVFYSNKDSMRVCHAYDHQSSCAFTLRVGSNKCSNIICPSGGLKYLYAEEINLCELVIPDILSHDRLASPRFSLSMSDLSSWKGKLVREAMHDNQMYGAVYIKRNLLVS